MDGAAQLSRLPGLPAGLLLRGRSPDDVISEPVHCRYDVICRRRPPGLRRRLARLLYR